MLLGGFLEVGVYAPDVVESLAFYESLGFVQASVGDTRSHPYAVVTDGRLYLGLHQHEIESPVLTWVRPGLAQHAPAFTELGIEFAFARLDEGSFNELGFRDPNGQMIAVVEARTYSPPDLAPSYGSLLGYFEEFGLPTSDLERSGAFWDALGFVAFEAVRDPFPRLALASRDLNVGLYDMDLRQPVLTFTDPQMTQRIEALREKGHRFTARLPRGIDARTSAILEAPEGTWLLLTTATD